MYKYMIIIGKGELPTKYVHSSWAFENLSLLRVANFTTTKTMNCKCIHLTLRFVSEQHVSVLWRVCFCLLFCRIICFTVVQFLIFHQIHIENTLSISYPNTRSKILSFRKSISPCLSLSSQKLSPACRPQIKQ